MNYYHHSRMDYQHGHLEKTNYSNTYVVVASNFFPSGETKSSVYINTYCEVNGIDYASLQVIEGAAEFEKMIG